ncbi:MAG: peroxiredoxin-like family protein [Bacteroidota bacterium]
MKIIFLIGFLTLHVALACGQDTLAMHSQAPLFEAMDDSGQKVSLQQLLLKGPVVVSFYRGQWCPYCNRHMSNLQDSLSFITALGASLVAITPEKNEEISKTISKTGASFSIIYDEGHKIMDAYKVTFKVDGFKNLLHFAEGVNINKASGNTDNVLPVPATYIIAPDGSIIGRHFDTDYTVRMPVKDILKVLNSFRSNK